MSDSNVLLRDIAGDAATKAAGKVNPSEDQLNQIDKPAEDNTWHEKPDFQGMKQQVRDKVPSKQERQEALGDATQAAHPQGTRDPNAAAPTLKLRDRTLLLIRRLAPRAEHRL